MEQAVVVREFRFDHDSIPGNTFPTLDELIEDLDDRRILVWFL